MVTSARTMFSRRVRPIRSAPQVQEDLTSVIECRGGSNSWVSIDTFVFWLFCLQSRQFFLFLLVSYVSIVTLFALLLRLPIGDYEHAITKDGPVHFGDAFICSFQTFSTVGYGVLSPDTEWAHFVTVLECMTGFLYVAVAGGVLFARVSTPRHTVHLSDVMVVSESQSGGEATSISVRMANERPNHALLEVYAKMGMIVQDGDRRRVLHLPLVRESAMIMRATWTLTHNLSPDSPLAGLTRENASVKVLALLVFVRGTDVKYMQPVYFHRAYYSDDLRFGSTFEDILEYKEGKMVLQLGLLHAVKPAK